MAEHLQGGGGGGEATLRRALTADPTVIDLTGQQPLPKRCHPASAYGMGWCMTCAGGPRITLHPINAVVDTM